jgi:hypothetical protein
MGEKLYLVGGFNRVLGTLASTDVYWFPKRIYLVQKN